MRNKAFKIKVSGVVQGVAFRYSTKLKADELGIVGWVKNESDGTVLISAAGAKDKITTFLEWCHRGPKAAVVDRLDYYEIDYFEADKFEINRSL